MVMEAVKTSGGTWIDYLLSVDTPTLSNAIEVLQIRPRHEGFLPVQTRCIFPELGRMAGYAVTAHVETVSTTEPVDMERFVELYEAVAASPKPAVIAFQEVGTAPELAAHSGEVMATTFTRLGAVGLVTDSAVRDIPEVRAMKFRYFATGAVASHASFRIVRTGVPIQIHGMVVRTGDILHGDENGVIHIPHGIEGTLPAAVELVRDKERELMEWIRGPEFSVQGLRARLAKLKKAD
jgi:4-hydroxy-4-methyl-2-oxoglutarate aldolase